MRESYYLFDEKKPRRTNNDYRIIQRNEYPNKASESRLGYSDESIDTPLKGDFNLELPRTPKTQLETDVVLPADRISRAGLLFESAIRDLALEKDSLTTNPNAITVKKARVDGIEESLRVLGLGSVADEAQGRVFLTKEVTKNVGMKGIRMNSKGFDTGK